MTTQETLVKYLSDMYALEEHLVQPLKSQVKDEDFKVYPQAHALVQRVLARSESALVELENLTQTLGGSARGVKSAVTAVAGAAAAVVNEARTHAITKKLRDDYVALSVTAVGYELLHTTGNALGSAPVAKLAQTRLHEVALLIMELSQEIIPVAVQELAKTNEVDSSTVEISQKNVKNAWTSRTS
jgi:ferritin-like metal-binding protein YciE